MTVFANNTSAVVSSGGTTAPASGTVQRWTVTSVTGFPTSLSGGQTSVVKAGKASGTLFQVAAATNVMVPLSQGDWFSVTYTSAPTITVIPEN